MKQLSFSARASLLFIIAVFSAATLSAQGYACDKEKIYIQTDHVFYAPGSTLFFKTYLVHGSDNKPSRISNIVYVEIIGPSGAIFEKQTYEIRNGYSEGSYTLSPAATGGIYKIKAYTTWMRNEKDSTFFTKSFTVQRIISPRILMKLDFEKKGYGPGDTVTAKFSMRSLDNTPIKFETGEFIVSLDGQTQTHGSFTTDAAGSSQLYFTLPKGLQTTDGLLNITVDYDSHPESIARSIPITLDKIDLQFLPEGGSFVTGLATNIAFKAINEFGKPVDVSGTITDDSGRPVAKFDSYKFGMGIFPFTPQPGQTYTATITAPANITTRYPLPAATAAGVILNIAQHAGILTIRCTTTSDRLAHIAGGTKDVTYFTQDLYLKKGINKITVREDLFPAGIAQFTLYSGDIRPLAERLIFLNSDKQLHVTLSTDKNRYLPREKVRMTLTTTDKHGQPIPANFSLAVVDDKLWSLADDRQDNILSWLLMTSELRGPIEEPPFYFRKDEPKAPEALDLVMLTNGYRYFDFIDEVIQKAELKFAPDEDNMVSGIVINNDDQPISATVFLVNNIPDGKAWQVRTGPDGQFYFPGVNHGGDYLLIAKSAPGETPIQIKLQQDGIGYNPWKAASFRQLRIDAPFSAIRTPIGNAPAPHPIVQPKKVNLDIEFYRRNALEEVVVTGYGAMRKKDLTASVAIVAGAELNAIPPGGMMQALQGKVAGLVITPAANELEAPSIRLRGARTITAGHEPLIVVDGVPQEKYNLSNLTVDDIEDVTVMKDAAALAIYGSRAANGVIVIRTKPLRNEKLRFNITRRSQYTSHLFGLSGPVFTVARRFYAPQYKSTVTDERNDFRETIYWNPVVQTDRDGRATVEFYNSDATTTFRAIAEGIGYNGALGHADTTYAARAGMSVDAKIPPYLTVGDQALIPVVIKNNGNDRLEGDIAVSLPNNMYTGNFDHTVTLDPGASRQVLIPLTASASTKGNLRISMTGNLGNETIDLPIAATAKGFPVIETISGNNNINRNLHLGQILPGTLHAQLTLYPDVAGQLMDGVESMLREPHGCFEQTSSSTYPNVFILKYLRQAGKSNPEIERKAMSYIEEGYKRLIGFETPQHGFEWFGHSPAHPALTAYGLLEFTDMEPFIDVDKQMLQRTKDFLLGRRDGHNGFKVASGGYDEFRAVPESIANIYIVYAMSQAGYGDEIKPEYAAAVRQAIGSNDAYQLAMMALAASNMHNDGDYRRLMDRLNANYHKEKLSAETSVVNSQDISLHVETMALYALALMRDNHPDLVSAAELITKILANKSYYGYGSTQGTILALEAVTEFTRLTGEPSRNADIRFTINGHAVTPQDSLATFLHSGDNNISVEFPDGRTGIPYNLEVSYGTLTPPNSEKAELLLTTTLGSTPPATAQPTPQPTVGTTIRMTITVTNPKDTLQPMAIAKIGIPAGLSLQPWQLKELTDHKQIAYYELFDNYLVLYWMGFARKETKTIHLDLKAEIPGKYKSKASNVYLYYTPEYKRWNEGLEVDVKSIQ